MRIEDEYMDVLQNIESIVAATYHDHDELSDYAVMRTYEALIDWLKAQNIGRKPRNFGLSLLEQQIFDDLVRICEWRLGRAEFPGDDPDTSAQPPKPITVDTLILCLKRLLKSAKTWNKNGRQGYLQFMSGYVMPK